MVLKTIVWDWIVPPMWIQDVQHKSVSHREGDFGGGRCVGVWERRSLREGFHTWEGFHRGTLGNRCRILGEALIVGGVSLKLNI